MGVGEKRGEGLREMIVLKRPGGATRAATPHFSVRTADKGKVACSRGQLLRFRLALKGARWSGGDQKNPNTETLVIDRAVCVCGRQVARTQHQANSTSPGMRGHMLGLSGC